jgi:hypothetical protein
MAATSTNAHASTTTNSGSKRTASVSAPQKNRTPPNRQPNHAGALIQSDHCRLVAGTADFFAVVAGVRTIDAQKRMMGLNQLQDQSIPLLNQMAFDISMGTDTVLGLLGDTFGFSGLFYGQQLGIFRKRHWPRPKPPPAKQPACLGCATPPTKPPTHGTPQIGRVSSWQFEKLNRAETSPGPPATPQGTARRGYGIRRPRLWTQALATIQQPMTATAMAPACRRGRRYGHRPKNGRQVDSPPDSTMLPNPAANTVPALANTEANRTFNNLNILWNKGANEETAGYRNFIHSSAQAWDSILNDTRPKYIIDIETTLRSQDIQIAPGPTAEVTY